MKYIFGPLRSRRLGNSLGINLTPYKTCTFDCVYCQLGRTTVKTEERKEYIPQEEIINELKLWLSNNAEEAKSLDFITLSGSGEPTLNLKLSQLIAQIKSLTSVPVAIITNASLLRMPALRRECLSADAILPSLDAVVQGAFTKINRPQEGMNVEDVIKGLIELRREFKGKIWLEVMLVRGINDDLRYIKKLKEAADKINPDKIHLNSPVRTTAEPDISPVDQKKLKKIKEILGEKAEII